MRLVGTLACGLVAASLCAAPSAAAPFAWLNWDQCATPFTHVTKTFAGPAVYHEIVSAHDFSGSVAGYVLKLVVRADNFYSSPFTPLPDAWRFDPAGCQAGRLAVVPDVSGCTALAPPGAASSLSATIIANELVITYAVTFPPYTPDPAARYVLADLAYDHTSSATGVPPSGCGGAELQACFGIQQASWLDTYLVAHAIGFETFTGLEWQPNAGLGCLGDLPVHSSSWGTVKTLYR